MKSQTIFNNVATQIFGYLSYEESTNSVIISFRGTCKESMTNLWTDIQITRIKWKQT